MTTIFISYAREDQERVLDVYDRLAADGFSPWMDTRDLKPGIIWEEQLQRAIRQCDLFCAFLSRHSIQKRGALQKELRQALRVREEKLEDDVYIIPVRLEDCAVPEKLRSIQWIDLYADDGYLQLREAISEQARRLAVSAASVSTSDQQITYETVRVDEFADGSPGYEAEIEIPHLTRFPSAPAMREFNARMSGFAVGELVTVRSALLCQDLKLFTSGDARSRNGRYVRYKFDTLDKSLISLAVTVGTYGAGAAHPNYYTITHNYLAPRLTEFRLDDLFEEKSQALWDVLSAMSLAKLREQQRQEGYEGDEDEWITSGASAERRNFETWSIRGGQLVLYFDPYLVGPYAWGRREVVLPPESLAAFGWRLEELLRYDSGPKDFASH